ncbi:MAG: response regulator [Bacteroidota bacterium]
MNILLVEDNPGDVRLTREALKEGGFSHEFVLNVVPDGEQAMLYLNKEAQFADVSTPDLIFMDLNIPRLDGREVLHRIKNDVRFKTIPVVILTTSEAVKDIQYSYETHANCYITKPVDISQYIEVIKTIENFWFTIVKLPTHPS